MSSEFSQGQGHPRLGGDTVDAHPGDDSASGKQPDERYSRVDGNEHQGRRESEKENKIRDTSWACIKNTSQIFPDPDCRPLVITSITKEQRPSYRTYRVLRTVQSSLHTVTHATPVTTCKSPCKVVTVAPAFQLRKLSLAMVAGPRSHHW